MTQAIQEACDQVTTALTSLDGVEAITLYTRSDHPDEPYFAILYDVYCASPVPSRADRREVFGFAGAFESDRTREKDRMFVSELPVRIEYRDMDELESALRSAESGYAGDPADSYGLYRIGRGEAVYGSRDRLTDFRQRSTALPESYWESLRTALRYKLEHALSDLLAAAAEGDDLFAFTSQAAFVEQVMRLVYADNHRHFPGLRHSLDEALNLANVPDHFASILEYLVNLESERSLARRAEFASTLARRMISVRVGD